MRLFKHSVVTGFILFAFLTLAISKPAFAVLTVSSSTDQVMDLGNATEDGKLNGVNFTGDGTLTIRNGSNINTNALTNGVTTATNNTGSLGFLGYSTVTGVVGTASTGLIRKINGGVADTKVTFTGANVYATTTNIMSSGTMSFAGNLTSTTVNFGGNGSVEMADNASITGTVTTDTTGTGSIAMLGTGTISGQVGTSSARLSTVTGGYITEKVDFSSDVYAVTTKVVGTGTLVFGGTLTGTTLNYNADGSVIVADGKNLAVTTVSTSTNNTGSVTFRGASTISGTFGSVAGNDLKLATVDGGIVTLDNGASDYAVTTTQVNSGGTFKMAGATETITTAVSVASGGNFDLGTSVVTENVGGVTIASGGKLSTTFGTTTTLGTLTATAAAPSISATSTLAVNLNGLYVPDGTYLVVDVNNAGINAPITTSSSSGVSITSSVTTNDLYITVARNYAAISGSGNAGAVGDGFSSFARAASGDSATIVAAFDNLGSAAAQDAALQQLDPDMNGGINQAALNSTSASLGTVSTRLDNARNGVASGNGQSGIATGDEFTDAAIWTQGFGAYGDQDDVKGIAGYTATTWGTAAGVDWKMNEDSRLGFAFSYGNSGIDANGGLSNTDVDSYQGTIYGSYDQPKYFIDWMGAFAWNEYDSTRDIVFGGINRTANGGYSGQEYSLKGTYGYKVPYNGYTLIPTASLLYSHLNIDNYTESDAGSLNLDVDGQDYDFLQSGLGAKIEIPQMDQAKRVTWMPEFHAMWLYDFIGDRASSTARFTGGGSSFTTNGFSPEQSSFNLGTGITVYPSDNLSLQFKYDFEIRDDYTGHSGSATLRWKF